MKRLASLTVLALAVFTMPAFAQNKEHAQANQSFASDFQTVPVMANTPGIGTTFQTYVAILNPTSSSFPVTVTLYDAAGAKHSAVITFAAGELKTYPNFLDAVFQFSGGGAVTFQSPQSTGGTHNNRIIVNAEIRTNSGRTGTTLPVLEFAGSSSRSFSPGITVDTNTRVNIGCFDQSGAANAVKATILDSTGTQTVGTTNLNLAANGWLQTSVGSIVSNGYVQFDPTDSAVCYAVVVDNTTNSGRIVPAAEYKP
jgi:hypothetical protein